ncbi:hypothetical protein CR513_15045, partial [Mucuna pruriens]
MLYNFSKKNKEKQYYESKKKRRERKRRECVISQVFKFKYTTSIVQNDGEIYKNFTHKIQIGDICVTPFKEKMIENNLRWFRHVQRKLLETLVRRID